jgi:hypothetical protein
MLIFIILWQLVLWQALALLSIHYFYFESQATMSFILLTTTQAIPIIVVFPLLLIIYWVKHYF